MHLYLLLNEFIIYFSHFEFIEKMELYAKTLLKFVNTYTWNRSDSKNNAVFTATMSCPHWTGSTARTLGIARRASSISSAELAVAKKTQITVKSIGVAISNILTRLRIKRPIKVFVMPLAYLRCWLAYMCRSSKRSSAAILPKYASASGSGEYMIRTKGRNGHEGDVKK